MTLQKEFRVGTRIWRGIHAFPNSLSMTELKCRPADRGGYLCKADSGRGHFTDELVAFNADCRFGMVCFIEQPPSGPWTYLEVTRVGYSGKSVHVRAVEGPANELLAQYKFPEGFSYDKNVLPPIERTTGGSYERHDGGMPGSGSGAY